MSRKHTGFRFSVQTVLLLLVAFLSSDPVLADTPLQVIVENNQSDPLSGLKVYAFSEFGSYTGKNSTTDENGTAFFVLEDFEPGTYQFRVDYLGRQPGRIWVDTKILTQMVKFHSIFLWTWMSNSEPII